MLWPREEFHAAYGQIKVDALQSGGCSVLLLVALDVDALCASEILTRLLQADFVSYSLLAVRGYEDILRVRESRIRDEQGNVRESELRSIVMVNCGAIVNVAQLLALPPHIKCYVFDSHRPIHLANIYDEHQQIVVFDDGAQALDDYPAYGSDIDRDEYESDAEEEEEDEEEEDDEGEEEFDPDNDGDKSDADEGEAEFGVTEKPADDDEEEQTQDTEGSPSNEKRKRSDASDTEDDENLHKKRKEDASNSEEDGHDVLAIPSTQEITDKEAKRQRREEILRYYRGSFYGAPAATIAFELAQQMNSSHRELLWYAIVGLTKQFVLEEIDVDNYNLMVHRFQDEVLAIDETPGFDSASQSVPTNPANDHGKIGFEEEYRFMCYRHWSLYESMYYSDYIASKLGLYLDQARRIGARNASNSSSGESETALHVFLARMGFSLRQSQQKFTYMPLEMKQMLRAKIQEISPEFGLDDIFYGSFKRHFAFQYQLCAADAVYGLQALLEAPESYISSVFQSEQQYNNSSGGTGGSGGGGSAISSLLSITASGISHLGEKKTATGEDNEDVQDDFRQQNFMLAHTALSCRSVESSRLMESGIKVAMELKQAIVRVGISIMERKLIVRVKHFRYVSLNIPEREQELFANANVLTQLALFLLNVHRASGKWGGINKQPVKKTEDGDDDTEQQEEVAINKSIVPLVLITRNPAQNCFLVVGISCPSTPGEVHRNTLGTAFKLAAGETGANFRQDGFTSAVMEIQMDEIQYFVEQLHNVLDA